MTNPAIDNLSRMEGSGSKHFSKNNSNPSLIVEQATDDIQNSKKNPQDFSLNLPTRSQQRFTSNSKRRLKRTSITAPQGSVIYTNTKLRQKFASSSNLFDSIQARSYQKIGGENFIEKNPKLRNSVKEMNLENRNRQSPIDPFQSNTFEVWA